MQRNFGQTDAIERYAQVDHSLRSKSEKVFVNLKVTRARRNDYHSDTCSLKITILHAEGVHLRQIQMFELLYNVVFFQTSDEHD